MNGVNKVILIGTVGKDAEVRALEGGANVARMSIAVNETYTDKEGQRKEKTEWINIEAWAKTATFLGNYGKKGTQFYIEGQLKTDSYEKDGIIRYTTKVVAKIIQFIGSKSTATNNTQANATPQNAAPQAPQAPQAQVPQAQAQQNFATTQQTATQQTKAYVNNEQFLEGTNNAQDDDLPF